MNIPLAERIRPTKIDEFIGQKHILNNNSTLYNSIINNKIHSMILWGPPGTGKTTIANIIANQLNLNFFSISATNSGVNDIKNIIEKAKTTNSQTILFIDEIHRFNKTQQTTILDAVEKGIITLIAATTENPSFEIIPPLLSRCHTYILKPLNENELNQILLNAIQNDNILKNKKITLQQTDLLINLSGGDARKLLNLFEIIINNSNYNEIIINNNIVNQFIQKNTYIYDKLGENHYDIISAFIKSIRGSDPNAALYWLARMTQAGEDPKFIARRLVILASEDIGLANPNAILIANACFDAVTYIGYPECELTLAQTTIFLATSPKSNSTYIALKKAKKLAHEYHNIPVPIHLRNAPTDFNKKIGYGIDYKYPHDYPDNFIKQQYLPEKLQNEIIYQPANNKREQEILNHLKKLWNEKY